MCNVWRGIVNSVAPLNVIVVMYFAYIFCVSNAAFIRLYSYAPCSLNVHTCITYFLYSSLFVTEHEHYPLFYKLFVFLIVVYITHIV